MLVHCPSVDTSYLLLAQHCSTGFVARAQQQEYSNKRVFVVAAPSDVAVALMLRGVCTTGRPRGMCICLHAIVCSKKGETQSQFSRQIRCLRPCALHEMFTLFRCCGGFAGLGSLLHKPTCGWHSCCAVELLRFQRLVFASSGWGRCHSLQCTSCAQVDSFVRVCTVPWLRIRCGLAVCVLSTGS